MNEIQITKDFLLKNGFMKEWNNIMSEYYYSKEIDGYFVDIMFGYSNISEDNVVCHIDNCDRCSIASVDIKYVHQLQNLLNIMNIENNFDI